MDIPGLTAEQLKLIRGFFPQNWDVKLFGSRVTGGFRSVSDLDICIISAVSRADITRIKELFAKGNFPFTADIVLYRDCGTDFKEIINSTGVPLGCNIN